MNIEQVIERSKEYHGSIKGNAVTTNAYLKAGYMCAIGCNLKDPDSLERYANKSGAYSIRTIVFHLNEIEEDFGYKWQEEPLLVKAKEDSTFMDQLQRLQNLHDCSGTVDKYLKALENFDLVVTDV